MTGAHKGTKWVQYIFLAAGSAIFRGGQLFLGDGVRYSVPSVSPHDVYAYALFINGIFYSITGFFMRLPFI